MRIWALILALIYTVYATSILSIDLGSDSLKIGLIGSGNLDVVLDKDSSRKLQSTVGFKGDDRLFGKQALQNSNKNPDTSYPHLKMLIGKTAEADSTQRWEAIFPAVDNSVTDRGTLQLHSHKDAYAIEELLAMQFHYARQLAQMQSGETIKDVVLTLPPYFSTYERQAVLDAVNLAALQPIALINDGTAVAVNYAMTRSFDSTPASYVIYDAGASSLSATFVEISSYSPPKKRFGSKQNTTEINVIGTAYDDSVGGVDLDHRLRNILADAFEQQHNLDQSWRGNARAWNKLLVEANRVKHILSANSESQATIEGLHDELDFKSTVSREQFKAAIEDYQMRWSAPISEVLAKTGRGIDGVDAVILTGGASRIPIIQSQVRAFVGDDKISTSVNADESAVLGAAFYGATFSKSFRTKPLTVHEASVYSMEGVGMDVSEHGTLLWKEGASLPTNNTISLPPRDATVVVKYTADSIPHDQQAAYMQLNVTGVDGALAEMNLSYEEAAAANVRVDIGVEHTSFSLVLPTAAELVVPAPASRDGLTGKLKEWFSVGAGGAKGEEKNENGTTTDSTTPTPPHAQEKRIKLTLSSLPASLQPMTVDLKGESMDKLMALNYAEAMEGLREETFNGFESKLYMLKALIENVDGKYDAFHNATLPEEMRALESAHATALTWLDEEGWSATLEQIQKEATKIGTIEQPVKERIRNGQVKAAALGDLQKALFAGRTFLKEARKNLTSTDESRYSFKEVDEFEAHLFQTENWLRPLMRKDGEAKPWEEGAYTATELEVAGRSVQNFFMELTERVPRKAEESVTESATESSQSTTSAPASEASSSGTHSDNSSGTQDTPGTPTPPNKSKSSGGIGQPLSLLTAQNPHIGEVSLFDVVPSVHGVAADLSHLDGTAVVKGYTKENDGLKHALTGANVVIIPAGVPRKPGMTRDDLFKINASICRDLATGIADYAPDAIVGVVSNPVNSTVPVFVETLKAKGVFNARKVFGVTTLDIVRSSKFVAEVLGKPNEAPQYTIPVIGGHSGKTIIPVISQSQPKVDISGDKLNTLVNRIQFGGDEVVKAKDGAGSATLSMAYAGSKFLNAVVSSVYADKPSVIQAYVYLPELPGGDAIKNDIGKDVSYFSVSLQLGKSGVEKVLPVGPLSDYEKGLLQEALPELDASIVKGVGFGKSSL
ncbi:hypothetical protein E3P91_00681 [Wallemia ichthyophaga]|nr:hypothetical protein E3P91_00681 [Wallemia ichthyophaga]TIB59350.1 hypothetical protein E3P78_03578 [Wallemia ichthyophaga]